MTRRICLAIAVILGLAGSALAVAGVTAVSASACENHTS
jgi:hypothetical protein